MNKKLISLLIAGSLVLGSSQAFAANVTIQDFAPGGGFSGGPTGVGNEDNETEPGTIQSQVWDLEAFTVVGTTLYIVGGYNMQAGEAGGGGSVVPGKLTPGDLFIKVGGTQPGFNPLANPPGGIVSNSVYDYTFAVDLTQPVGATMSSASVYSLSGSSVLNTVVYDQFGANPWKYSNSLNSALPTASAGLSYSQGLNNAQAQAVTGAVVTGGLHNVLAIDMSWMSVPVGVDVWFSYTMECGNDSLKGKYSGGFYQVPDSATSVLLIAMGLAAMSLFGFKSRKA